MAEVIILGGGIMGLSAAWALAGQGHRVTVLEQDPIPNPRGSSVDDHRLIRHAYGAAAGYMRMVDEAYPVWEELFAAIGERPYAETGVLALAEGDAPGWLGESRLGLRGDGHAVEDPAPAELAARYPWLVAEGLSDAFVTPRGGVLMARRIVAGLFRHLAGRGVRFVQGQATEVDPDRRRITLSDGRTMGAEKLVVAAGPWGPRLLPTIAPRVTPTRQVVVYLEPPPEFREAWARAPMVLDLSARGGFYAVPPVEGTGLKIGDHRFSPGGDPDDPREASASERDAILALALPRLRDAARYRVVGARACYYDVEPSERFVVEELAAGCVVMSGFSGHGFKFAPLLGRAVAEALERPDRMPALSAWASGAEGRRAA